MNHLSTRQIEMLAVLRDACELVGLDSADAEMIRSGENVLYRIPGGIVVRISRPGQLAAARREIAVTRWLRSLRVPAVQPLLDIDQPVHINERAVTFWHELPPHRHGTPSAVASALRRLHAIPIPTGCELGGLAPFARLRARIDGATTLSDQDRTWMRGHLVELMERYSDLPPGLPSSLVHGDAWGGNIVVTEDHQAVLLDLERCSIGSPEWDLVHTAIKHFSFGWISMAAYAEFVMIYGYDVTAWTGFALLRDIREFRMTCMAAQVATENAAYHGEAVRRLASIRGQRGSRPWTDWQPIL